MTSRAKPHPSLCGGGLHSFRTTAAALNLALLLRSVHVLLPLPPCSHFSCSSFLLPTFKRFLAHWGCRILPPLHSRCSYLCSPPSSSPWFSHFCLTTHIFTTITPICILTTITITVTIVIFKHSLINVRLLPTPSHLLLHFLTDHTYIIELSSDHLV